MSSSRPERARGVRQPWAPVRFRVRRSGTRRSRGQALAEFALIVPALLLLAVMAIDFGRVFFTYVQTANAAREGANIAAGVPSDTAGITARVVSERSSQGQAGESAVTVTTTCANSAGTTIACTAATGGAGPGNTVTVTVEEQFTFFTPLISAFFGGGLTVTNSASAVVLGYVPSSTATQPPGCATAPVASFTVSPTTGNGIFADPTASTPNSGICNISGYNWTWGDGNETVGSAIGDAHVFAGAGTYTITLEVTNQAGADTMTQTITVPFVVPTPSPSPSPSPSPTPTVGPTPTPSPTPTPTPSPTPTPIVCAAPTPNFTWTQSGKTYTYRDASTVADPVNCPITDWEWTFTDASGLKSNAQNPAPVTYGNNSSHPVTLKVTNAGGSRTITKNS